MSDFAAKRVSGLRFPIMMRTFIWRPPGQNKNKKMCFVSTPKEQDALQLLQGNHLPVTLSSTVLSPCSKLLSPFATGIPCDLHIPTLPLPRPRGHRSTCGLSFLFLLSQRSQQSWMLALLSFCRTWKVFLPARCSGRAVPCPLVPPSYLTPSLCFFLQVFY